MLPGNVVGSLQDFTFLAFTAAILSAGVAVGGLVGIWCGMAGIPKE